MSRSMENIKRISYIKYYSQIKLVFRVGESVLQTIGGSSWQQFARPVHKSQLSKREMAAKLEF